MLVQFQPILLTAIVLYILITNNKTKGEKTMRKEMVSRGIDGTKATIKVINTTNDEITTREVVVSKDLTGEDNAKKLNKAVVKTLTEGEVLIRIESAEVIHKLFGMELSQFLAQATELDPVTRKPINA